MVFGACRELLLTRHIADQITLSRPSTREIITIRRHYAQTGFRLAAVQHGAWISYGIGCETEDCRHLCDIIGGGGNLFDRLWGNAFCPPLSRVKFRSVEIRFSTSPIRRFHFR